MESIAILREWLLALNEKVDMKVKPENKEWFLELIDKTIEVTQPIDENDFEAVAEVCTERFAKAMRAKGWLHKDDPVKGLKVEMACPECDGTGSGGRAFNGEAYEINCGHCDNGKLSCPLTVGEALEIFTQTIGSNYLLTELTTKDGGRIVRI